MFSTIRFGSSARSTSRSPSMSSTSRSRSTSSSRSKSRSTFTPSRFQRPGLNLPLDWTPHQHKYARGSGNNLFPTALTVDDNGWCALEMTTLREFTMLDIMNSLTDKLGWEEKVFDDTIVEKWKAEALKARGRDVTQKMVDWVIEELRYKAKIFKNSGAVSVFTGDVVKSDTAIPTLVKESLQRLALELENVPEIYKDYHPGSDGKVLDLVHPSLFPLIYGRTRVLKDTLIGLEGCIESCGKGSVASIRLGEETELDGSGSTGYRRRQGEETAPFSKNFQWLPSEVEFDENGTAKFSSYINNLHPQKHHDLYNVIEQVLNRAIPLWDMTLTPLKGTNSMFKRIHYSQVEYDPDPENMPEEDQPQQEEDEDEDTFYERRDVWARGTRRVVQPEPEEFSPPEIPDDSNPRMAVNLKRDYGRSGLQVIVKLANIELSPEKPVYEGGTWHVEGKLNEHICATALYYYDNENIAPSRLAFRQQCTDNTMDIGYEQEHHEWLREVFGCEQDGPSVQEVGSVLCSEGRLLTFPNILQHRVERFELADVCKKGHRKILALFLVDPGIKIVSTANVPPQRRDWWSESVIKGFERSGRALGILSSELKQKVFEEVDSFPISMEDAKEIRLELMEERKIFVAHNVASFEQQRFSLCEH